MPIPALLAAEAEPNLFAGSILQALAAIIAFLVVLFILRKYAWGPILDGLQAREDKIRTDLENAEKAQRDAQASLDEYKKQLAGAQAEAKAVIAQSRTTAQQVAENIKADAEREITQMKERATKDIAAAQEAAKADIYAQAADLSTLIAGKILQRELSADDHQALVTQTVQQLDPAKL